MGLMMSLPHPGYVVTRGGRRTRRWVELLEVPALALLSLPATAPPAPAPLLPATALLAPALLLQPATARWVLVPLLPPALTNLL
jgi:hypothetical protein